MIIDIVVKYVFEVFEFLGFMYICFMYIGMEVFIGKVVVLLVSFMLYVLLLLVGDYFVGGLKLFCLLLDEIGMCCVLYMGMVKSGGNYVSVLFFIFKVCVEV